MNAPAITTPDRSKFIGGSDIGAIVGVSKWKTALDLYREKTGQAIQAADPEREKMFRRGKRMEPVIIEMLAEERGLQIVARNKRYVDAEFPFMACEIDAEAEIDSELVNVEIKTSHPFAAGQWGEEGTDEIDVSYAAQAMWGLMITGRKRTIFGVLIGSDNLVTYEVRRDDETIAGLRARAAEFWNRNVLAGMPPAPQNLPDVYHLFKREAETKIEATPEVAEYVSELIRAGNDLRAAEARQEELKFRIGTFMLGAEALEKPTKKGKHVLTVAGAEILNVTLQEQSRVSATLVKERHPTVAAECTVSQSFFVYRPKRSKK